MKALTYLLSLILLLCGCSTSEEKISLREIATYRHAVHRRARTDTIDTSYCFYDLAQSTPQTLYALFEDFHATHARLYFHLENDILPFHIRPYTGGVLIPQEDALVLTFRDEVYLSIHHDADSPGKASIVERKITLDNGLTFIKQHAIRQLFVEIAPNADVKTLALWLLAIKRAVPTLLLCITNTPTPSLHCEERLRHL